MTVNLHIWDAPHVFKLDYYFGQSMEMTLVLASTILLSVFIGDFLSAENGQHKSQVPGKKKVKQSKSGWYEGVTHVVSKYEQHK